MTTRKPFKVRLARWLWNRAVERELLLPVESETKPIGDRRQLGFYPILDHEHPKTWTFPPSLDNPGCAWLQSIKSLYDEPIIFPASLSPEAGLMLHSMIRNFRPRTIVEVGMFMSVSTHWMASALLDSGVSPRHARIHCFDNFGPIHKDVWRDAEILEGREQWVRERLAASGLIDYIEIHPGNSPTELVAANQRLIGAGGVDFAFLDGDHSVAGVMADFLALEPALNTGGYVLLHDTYPDQCGGHEGPRYLADNANKIGAGRYENIDLYLAPLNYGMALLRRIG